MAGTRLSRPLRKPPARLAQARTVTPDRTSSPAVPASNGKQSGQGGAAIWAREKWLPKTVSRSSTESSSLEVDRPTSAVVELVEQARRQLVVRKVGGPQHDAQRLIHSPYAMVVESV
jgi:hypothetical protein